MRAFCPFMKPQLIFGFSISLALYVCGRLRFFKVSRAEIYALDKIVVGGGLRLPIGRTDVLITRGLEPLMAREKRFEKD